MGMLRPARSLALALAMVSSLVPALVHAAETRCGILSNPTPANWWLTDADGEWTIGYQGGYQAEGLDTLPEALFEDGWVRVNGYYGYRCACLRVDTDPETSRILRIHDGQPRAMRDCDSDGKLQRALRK